MTIRLVEGQDFSGSYALLERLSQSDVFENWLALDKSSSERVMLRIFLSPLAADQREQIESAVATGRGLVHPHIARLHRLEQGDGLDYLVCQYVRAQGRFVPVQVNFTAQWPLLEQLFDVLAFAHNLGVAHGHLHPGNLLLAEQNGLLVTGFGLPAELQDEAAFIDWLSPQVRQGQVPDRSDDVYSLGYLLYLGLTGKEWREDHGFETDSPVPDEARHLITAMLATSPWERPRNLSHVRDIIRRYVFGESDAPLESLGEFSRPRPATRAEPVQSSQAPLRESRVMSAPIAFAGFALLAILAGIVFVLLPRIAVNQPASQAAQPTVASDQPAASSASTQKAPQLTPLEIARRKQLQKESNDTATRLLQLQAQLEDVGVQLWAPDKYNQVLDLGKKGDAAYRNGDYRQALDMYKEGVKTLDDLNSEVASVKAENLSRGKAALDKGDYRSAIKAYTIVDAIDPNDSEVKKQLQRSENLQQVLALIKDGDYLESEGKYKAARIKFAAARKLDPAWQPAAESVKRVDAEIAKRNFDDAMSVAFTALEAGHYDKASAAFRRAQKILPGSTEPADGLEQVKIAVRQQKIESRRKSARLAISAENWPAAIAAYQKILAIDPTLVFAQSGLKRVEGRLQLDQAMEKYIQHPTLMSSDTELANARKLLVEATRVQSSGPRLASQMDKLSQLISVARIPVTVQLKSDNRTDVTVYHVGHLGKLESTSLKLVPGKYTIIGQRDGYRDVQRQLTVLGDKQIKPVYISCTDKI